MENPEEIEQKTLSPSTIGKDLHFACCWGWVEVVIFQPNCVLQQSPFAGSCSRTSRASRLATRARWLPREGDSTARVTLQAFSHTRSAYHGPPQGTPQSQQQSPALSPRYSAVIYPPSPGSPSPSQALAYQPLSQPQTFDSVTLQDKCLYTKGRVFPMEFTAHEQWATTTCCSTTSCQSLKY